MVSNMKNKYIFWVCIYVVRMAIHYLRMMKPMKDIFMTVINFLGNLFLTSALNVMWQIQQDSYFKAVYLNIILLYVFVCIETVMHVINIVNVVMKELEIQNSEFLVKWTFAKFSIIHLYIYVHIWSNSTPNPFLTSIFARYFFNL